MKNSLSNKKINLFKTYKNYFSKKSKQLDITKSPFAYPCTWHANTGYYNLKSLYIGVDPFHNPDTIDLINEKKYQLMNSKQSLQTDLLKLLLIDKTS